MKKKILSTIFVIVIAAVAVTNIVKNNNSHHTEEVMKDLALENVEALAQISEGEGGGDNCCCVMHLPCFDNNGNTTGRYSACSYQGPGCNKSWHSHSCSSCSSLL
ncbi:hypothetical protein TFKS16_1135 [Tannerella forsythia KS16]|jgi:hypothetical protein|uniref:NVEALA protein n=1 Tax=Tannerella forsythia TaxID=28112 RepID=A0A1D3UHN4_TANFO|nr:NVEALA domain-containing protein [Tannerella forsythia]PDP44394.1 hypothetical protein CLI86_03920 [Tannerella forsythia]PDP72188.1 hypothetical protein CLI85_01025 [Tannerella forsythia]TPE17869.1 hypothetical protein FJN16_04760 [Tannerella forsythia]SCQ19538.1 hypothetical protein TFUB4_00857 [Tannerella forsythia]SCQ20244.1 hypothetical protein TFUB20_00973 [Tannerella forsythia]